MLEVEAKPDPLTVTLVPGTAVVGTATMDVARPAIVSFVVGARPPVLPFAVKV